MDKKFLGKSSLVGIYNYNNIDSDNLKVNSYLLELVNNNEKVITYQ